VTISINELKNGMTDVSGVIEFNKNNHMTKGFKRLSELLPDGLLFLSAEPIPVYNNGRSTGEVSGYRVKVLSGTMNDTIEVNVADDLPENLSNLEKIDFENCLMMESASKLGSGDFERYPITRRFSATRVVRYGQRPNMPKPENK